MKRYPKFPLFVTSVVFILSAFGCNLPAPTVTTTSNPITLTPTNLVTPTYPCPIPTQERPPMVSPLTSPTNETSQAVQISGNFEFATIRTESGEFSATRDPDNGALIVVVTLLPNTIHHLTVTAQVTLRTWENCSYGGYTMTTVTDSEGGPLTIVQGVPPTPAASTQPISLKNVSRITQLGSLDGIAMMSGFIFAGEFELLTYGYNQPATRWLLPNLTRLGSIGEDEPWQPAPVSADYFPQDHPTLLAVGGAGNPGGSEEFSVKYYNIQDNQWNYLSGHGGPISTIAFSPSGKLLASAANDDAVQVWNVDGSGMQSVFHSGREGVMESFYCLSWIDETTLWAGGNQALYRINTADGSLLQSIKLDGNYACSFSADGRWFSATDQSITLKLVDLQSEEVHYIEPYSPDQYPGYLADTALSPDGELVVAINSSGMWFLWSTADRKLLLMQPSTLADGYYIKFSPGGYYLALGGWKSPVVQLWGIP